MRIHLLRVALPLVLAGCSAGPSGPDETATAPTEEVEQLKRQLSNLEGASRRSVEALQEAAEARKLEYESRTEDYRQQVLLKNQRITALEKEVRDAEAYARSLQEQIAEKIASAGPTVVPTERGRLLDAPPVPPVFPVRIRNVSGRQVVTGTYTRPRYVESDETYRDEFGNIKKRIVAEDQVVEEHGYQVTFVAENPTDAEARLSARAGSRTQTFLLAPGETRTNLVVDAALGSGLRVSVGGESRAYDVTY